MVKTKDKKELREEKDIKVPSTQPCQTTCTVKHILMECRAFAIRKQFFKVISLTDLFENVKIDDVLSLRYKSWYAIKPKQPTT